MYAIVDIAGQQIKVEKDQKVFVHRLEGNEGSKVEFRDILLLEDKGKINVGKPFIEGALITATILSHLKGDKVIVFKKKRRKGYQKSNGHRQYLTEILIESIDAKGKPASKAEPKAEAKAEDKKETKAKAETKVKAETKAEDKKETKAKAEPKAKAEAKTEDKKETKAKAEPKAKAEAKKEDKPKPAPKAKTDVKEKLKEIMDAKAEADSKIESKSKEENNTEEK